MSEVDGKAGGTGINQRPITVRGGTHGVEGDQLIGSPELGANRQPCRQLLTEGARERVENERPG